MITYTVTNNGDIPVMGFLTLREAIALSNANPGSSIDFAVVGIISLLSGELLITSSTTIIGPGANILTVQRDNTAPPFRIFNIDVNEITVSISGLTISNGLDQDMISPSGGAILNSSGILTVNSCQFQNNYTDVSGGAIFSINPIRIFNCTFKNNESMGGGGAIFLFTDNNDSFIINCTFNNNETQTYGGAISIAPGSICTIINCTIIGNTAIIDGGGVDATNGSSSVFIGNNVISNNISNNIIGVYTDLGNNFIGGNPLVLPLGNYGGPTETMLPSIGSPLINSGSNQLVTTYFTYPELQPTPGVYIDQRNYYRIINGVVDIGAVEFGSTIICYTGDSMILCKNMITGEVSEIPAKNVISGTHEVFDMNDKKYIPIIYNAVTGPMTRFIKIPKNLLGVDQPNRDFFVTTGHKLLINGNEVKARMINNVRRVKTKPQKIYSICTEKEIPIMINGLAVLTQPKERFLGYCKKNNIYWINNGNNSDSLDRICQNIA